MVETYLVMDEIPNLSLDETFPRCHALKGYKDIADVDLTFSENIILQDFDSYFDELNVYIHVQRMIDHAVITSVIQEANEKMISKNAEVAYLTDRLQFKLNGLEEDRCDEYLHIKDHLSFLLCENQHFRDLLAEERQEMNNLLSHTSSSKTPHHSQGERIFADKVTTLTSKVDASETNKLHSSVQGIMVDEDKYNMEISELEVKSIHEIYSAMLGGYVQDCIEWVSAITLEHNMLKRSLEDNLHEKDKALKFETEKTKMLMQEIETLSKLVKEKEKDVEEAKLALYQKSEHFDALCKEMNILKDQESNQAAEISEHKNIIYILSNKLEMGTKQIQQYAEKVGQLDENLTITVRELNDTKKHQNALHDIIKEKENVFAMSKAVQTEEVRSLIRPLLQLLKAFDILESNVMESIQRNNLRLGNLKNLVNQSTQFSDNLQGKLLWYKQNLEMKSSNLRKAETEVDLLGDEVDLLLDTLSKIYFALDHYAPVLQHYPAVMEILKLIKRVLNRYPKAS